MFGARSHLAALVLFAVVLVSPAWSDCPPGALFTMPAAGYAVGTNPHDAAIGDFNEDGKMDVAVVNSAAESGGAGGNTVSVRLGTGGGALGSETTYATDTRPYGIAAADFNNDGILDLAVACVAAGTVDIFIGQGSGGVGNGTFGTKLPFPANESPYRLAVGDYNEDGLLDLVALNNTYSTPGLSVLLAVASGTPGEVAFAAPAFLPLPSAPAGLTNGDFNEDGILDLAATVYDGGVLEILLGGGSGGVGNGTFGSPSGQATTSGAFDIQAADFNEDGILDLVTSGNGGGVWVHRGLGAGGVGNGSFAAGTPIGGGNVSDVEVGDFDGDGILDLAVSTGPRNQVFVFRGLGSGGVGNGNFGASEPQSVGDFCIGLASGDLNADGHPDLVSVAYHGSEIRTLLTGCPPPPPPPNNAPHLDRVKDVPNDEGGFVFVLWQRSALDGLSGNSVTSYRIWRRVPSLAPSLLGESARLSPRGDLAGDSSPLASAQALVRTDGAAVTYWEALATLPAQRLEGYGYTAATTQDSLPGSNPFTAFFVTALTADINTFYNSNVDSGYSVDNTPPAQPSGLHLTYGGQGAVLEWLANSESDLECYRLYRGSSESFVPAAENLVADVTTLTYTDPQGAPGTFYKLCAVDQHENCSGFVTAGQAGPVGVGTMPARLSLAGPWPNPSRSGVFSVSVTHPHPGRVTFDVYDVRGTRVFSRRLEDAAPGVHTFTVGADHALGAGLYMIRVTNGGDVRQIKTTVMQ